MNRFTPATKAWVAAVGAALAAAIPTAVPLVENGLTVSEVLIILGAALAGAGFTGGVTYAAPANRERTTP